MQVETNTTKTAEHYSSKELNHLGLVSGMYDELGLGEVIDQLIPQDDEKRVLSIGQAVKAMVLNGLGFTNRALYLTPHFFKDKPVSHLIGEGIEAEHLNDDVLGRALDAIYQFNPEKLYSHLSLVTVKHLDLLCQFGHLDSSSFHVEGQYNSQDEVEEGVIKITRGYSRDHRPDLNQVVLQLICEQQAGIPLMMESLSGNNNDKNSFKETINKHIEQMHNDFHLEFIVADSALYVSETLKNLNEILWISRVPGTLKLSQNVIEMVAPYLMQNPQETSSFSLEVNYADVKQRWLVVYSPEAYHRTVKTVNKRCLKQTATEHKAFSRLCKQDFACEADALKALDAFEKKQKMTAVTEIEIQNLPRYKGKGRPTQNQSPDFYVYQIKGHIYSQIQNRTRLIEQKSCFILATNQLDWKSFSHQQLISVYKNQQKVERGFRFLKDPMFMANTLFLKSPKRIMALMMIMTLCLLIYAALQYRIRTELKIHNQTFPNQTGQDISNPTARWVFQFFSGIHVLIINQTRTIILNLNQHHLLLLKLLGNQYEQLYCGNG